MDMAQEIYDRILHALIQGLQESIQSGETQDDLADKCGMTQPTMQRLLAGKRGANLPLKTVLRIAVALDIDLAPLLSIDPPDKQEKLKILLAEISKMIANG